MTTLRARLTWALVALVLFLGALYVVSTWLTTEAYTREVQQQLNLELADHIVAERLLLVDGEVDEDALHHIFHMMMVINPSIELYLLDLDGRILADAAPEGRVQLERVDLEPVRRYLQGPLESPILGDNPRQPGEKKAFSAAPIPPEGDPEGYLYIVLGGDLYDSAADRLRTSFILRSSLWTGLFGLLLALAVGTWIFGRLTNRLRRLDDKVSSFHARDQEAAQDEAETAGDEIDRLDRTFDRLLERLEAWMAERDRLHRERRDLINSVSHDLRTPLTALQGYLETVTLKEKTLQPEERREYLEIALRHAERLSRLVGELLELTRLDSAEPGLEAEPFSLAELAQDNIQRFQLPAEERGLHLVCQTQEGLPFVYADISLIERAMANLIDNALRFTPAGGEVTVQVEEEDQDRVRLSVRDTGCGIAPDELPHVFERYYRTPTAASDHYGTGLGLAITSRIAELHGGHIEVESRPGEGSVFRFSLPAHQGTAR